MTEKEAYKWRGVQRCLQMLHRLMRGDTPKSDLMEIIYADARHYGEDLTDSAAEKKFQRDRAQLKEWFDCDAPYVNGVYRLNSIARSLIDLPDEAIHTFAFLEQNFSAEETAMGEEVQKFLNFLKAILPTERQKLIERERGILEMDLRVRDDDEIDDEVWNAVKRSVSERRQLEFDYHANADGLPRRHLVEPIRYYFDSVRKHYYLEGIWLSSNSHVATNNSQDRKVQVFRLGRMSNAKLLEKHFPTIQRIPSKELVYILSPKVARLGVTKHFPDMQIFMQEDGSAKVSVASRHLFLDLRTLLHYGDNCRVIAGEEAVKDMKKIVKSLYGEYFGEETHDE